MNPLRLTMIRKDGTTNALLINPDKLVSVLAYDDDTSRVIVHGATYRVQESAGEIYQQLIVPMNPYLL